MGFYTDENGVVRMEIIKSKTESLKDEVDEIKGSGILSSENYQGNSSFNFDSNFLDDFTNDISPINQSQLNNATNLLEATKQSSQMISASVNELTNSINNISNVLSRGNLSTDNLGVNLRSVLGSLVNQIAVGNRISSVKTELDSIHQEQQTAKNIEQMEAMRFDKLGNESLKNSNNEVIKPREAKAIKESEEGIEAKRANTTDLRPMLDELANIQNNEETDIDIVSHILNMMVDNIDVTKIDNNIGVN